MLIGSSGLPPCPAETLISICRLQIRQIDIREPGLDLLPHPLVLDQGPALVGKVPGFDGVIGDGRFDEVCSEHLLGEEKLERLVWMLSPPADRPGPTYIQGQMGEMRLEVGHPRGGVDEGGGTEDQWARQYRTLDV